MTVAVVDVSLSYDPSTGQWTITKSPDDQPVEMVVKRVTRSSEAGVSGVGTQPAKGGAQPTKKGPQGAQSSKGRTQAKIGGAQPKEVKVMKQALETMDGLVDELEAAKI